MSSHVLECFWSPREGWAEAGRQSWFFRLLLNDCCKYLKHNRGISLWLVIRDWDSSCIHPFIHSFNKYVLKTNWTPTAFLDPWHYPKIVRQTGFLLSQSRKSEEGCFVRSEVFCSRGMLDGGTAFQEVRRASFSVLVMEVYPLCLPWEQLIKLKPRFCGNHVRTYVLISSWVLCGQRFWIVEISFSSGWGGGNMNALLMPKPRVLK